VPKIRLNQRSVESLACPAGRKDVLVFDAELTGFGLRVTAAGTKVFLVQYNAFGIKRRAKIGNFGTLTVEQARREAKALLGKVASGEDPQATRKAVAEAARATKVAEKFTFARMVAGWAAARNANRRPSYLKEAVACITRNLPTWQDRPASGVTFAEAVQALDDIKSAKGIVAANRTLAYARAAYGWAVRREQVPANPLKGIERPGREVARERVLTVAEVAWIWRACDVLSLVRAAFVRTLMLTLQRVSEVASMQWSELDSLTAPTVWVLPGERAKNGKPHIVHLAAPVRVAIHSLPMLRGNPFVFAGKANKPIDGSTHTKEPIEMALGRLGVSIPNWRLHDFRRAGVTALAEAGTAPHIADRLLNRVTGSISGVAAVYQRAQFLQERQAALDVWAALVLAAVDVQTSATGAPGLHRPVDPADSSTLMSDRLPV
jgi:integrase